MSSGKGEWVGLWSSHAYSRKYSRLSLLDASLTLVELHYLFSQRQLHYRLRLAHSCERINGNHILLIEDQQGSQRKRQVLRPAFSLCLEFKMTTLQLSHITAIDSSFSISFIIRGSFCKCAYFSFLNSFNNNPHSFSV